MKMDAEYSTKERDDGLKSATDAMNLGLVGFHKLGVRTKAVGSGTGTRRRSPLTA